MMPKITAWPVAALLLALAPVGGLANAAESARSPQVATAKEGDAAAAKRQKAERELEALLLQTLVATAFTKKDMGPFGGGAAGRQWQAMMTEHVARAMAASGQIRIFPSPRGRATARSRVSARPPAHLAPPQSSIPGWVTVTKPEVEPGAVRTVSTDAGK